MFVDALDGTSHEVLFGDYDLSFDDGKTWYHVSEFPCVQKCPRLPLKLPRSRKGQGVGKRRNQDVPY